MSHICKCLLLTWEILITVSWIRRVIYPLYVRSKHVTYIYICQCLIANIVKAKSPVWFLKFKFLQYYTCLFFSYIEASLNSKMLQHINFGNIISVLCYTKVIQQVTIMKCISTINHRKILKFSLTGWTNFQFNFFSITSFILMVKLMVMFSLNRMNWSVSCFSSLQSWFSINDQIFHFSYKQPRYRPYHFLSFKVNIYIFTCCKTNFSPFWSQR